MVEIVAEWEVWRLDEDGNRDRLASYDDRVDALARAVADGAAVSGPPGPVSRTSRDLSARLDRLGRELAASGRTLPEYLRGWWSVGARLRGLDEIDPDLFVGMLVAAARIDPPPADPTWHTADLASGEWDGYPLWERIVKSQVADLDELRNLRPSGSGRRATGSHWDSLDPATYLTCAAVGAFGSDDEPFDDGLTWDDIAEFALCGQMHA